MEEKRVLYNYINYAHQNKSPNALNTLVKSLFLYVLSLTVTHNGLSSGLIWYNNEMKVIITIKRMSRNLWCKPKMLILACRAQPPCQMNWVLTKRWLEDIQAKGRCWKLYVGSYKVILIRAQTLRLPKCSSTLNQRKSSIYKAVVKDFGVVCMLMDSSPCNENPLQVDGT